MPRSEFAVLGCVIIDPSCLDVVESECTPLDFEDARARVVYESILRMRDSGLSIDHETLGTHLQAHGLLEKAGGPLFLSKITDYQVTSANVQSYAKQVAEAALVRRIQEASRIIAESDTSDPYAFASGAVEIVTRACESSAFLDDAEPAYAAANRRLKSYRDGTGKPPIKTGFHGLAHDLVLHPELTILAAHAGTGKSTLALNILVNVAIAQGKPALYISLEDSKDTISDRLLSLLSGVRLRSIRDRTCRQEDMEALNSAVATMARGNLMLSHCPGWDVARIALTMRREIYRRGVEMVVIDHFMRIKGKGKRSDEYGAITEKLRDLADVAQQLQVPTLLLHHPNKPRDGGKGKLTYHDLKYGGGDEARAVWILSRDLENKSGVGDDLEIDIAKNNNGPTGTINASYDLRVCWMGHKDFGGNSEY